MALTGVAAPRSRLEANHKIDERQDRHHRRLLEVEQGDSMVWSGVPRFAPRVSAATSASRLMADTSAVGDRSAGGDLVHGLPRGVAAHYPSRLMPTDPFVNPDLDDRPRHRQNLPAGVTLPPSGHWTGGRPGDAAAQNMAGELRGTPGPNVGFGYTLAERASSGFETQPSEDRHDAASVVAEIAMKRAASFGRAPVVGDIEFAVELLGYDGRADDDFVRERARRVHGAGHDYPRRRAIVDAVPLSILRLSRKEIGEAVPGWREEFLALPS